MNNHSISKDVFIPHRLYNSFTSDSESSLSQSSKLTDADLEVFSILMQDDIEENSKKTARFERRYHPEIRLTY
ncbi:hypothetical protein QTN25_000052 [Entamoeba marina]